jgi:hypothetical protein
MVGSSLDRLATVIPAPRRAGTGGGKDRKSQLGYRDISGLRGTQIIIADAWHPAAL